MINARGKLAPYDASLLLLFGGIVMTPATLIGRATMIKDRDWKPDIVETDALLVQLSKLHKTHDVVVGKDVGEMIDHVLDYRRELSLAAQAKELTWPTT